MSQSYRGVKFIDDLGADSLDTVELVMALKRNLDQKFLIAKLRKY